MKHTKCLLKETRFEKDVFKLKIEPVLMCMCPHFHSKLKWLVLHHSKHSTILKS